MFLSCLIYTKDRNPRSGSQNSDLHCRSAVTASPSPTPYQSQTQGLLTDGDAVAPEPAPLLAVLILNLPPSLSPWDLRSFTRVTGHCAKETSRPLQGYQALALFLGTQNATWSTNQRRGLQKSGDRWSLNYGGQFSGPGGPWTHRMATSSMPDFIINIDTRANWHSH